MGSDLDENVAKRVFLGFASFRFGSDHPRLLRSGSGVETLWKGGMEPGDVWDLLRCFKGKFDLWRVGQLGLGHYLATNSINDSKLEQVPGADPGQVEPIPMGFISIHPKGDIDVALDNSLFTVPVFQFVAFRSV